MKHIIAFATKFIMISVILEIILGIMTALSFGEILLMSLVVSIALYIIGDLLVFPVSNNIIATITDAALVLLILHMFNWSGFGVIDIVSSVVAAVVIGLGELVFHRFIGSYSLSNQNEPIE